MLRTRSAARKGRGRPRGVAATGRRPPNSVRERPPEPLASAPVPHRPQLPDGLTARPLTADDVDAVAALLEAAERVDDTGEHLDADDLTEWWGDDLVDLSRDGLAVVDAGGTVVGYATVMAPPTFRDAFGVYLEGRVHPEHRGRGIGRALLGWQLARGAQVHAERH